jgi:ketosteroid isomerase-like protein
MSPLDEIEKLHEQDIKATLAFDPNELAKLWADDAVRVQHNQPEPGQTTIDKGKAEIRATDEKQKRESPQAKVEEYTPDIRGLTVCDGWAFESVTFTSRVRLAPGGEVVRFEGKAARVLQRQQDGTWKFAWVSADARPADPA